MKFSLIGLIFRIRIHFPEENNLRSNAIVGELTLLKPY